MRVQSLASLSGLGSSIAESRGVGRRCSLDWIPSPGISIGCRYGHQKKRKKKKKKKKKKNKKRKKTKQTSRLFHVLVPLLGLSFPNSHLKECPSLNGISTNYSSFTFSIKFSLMHPNKAIYCLALL